ncbi:MAG: PhoH family protein [Gemmatimonadales bacterium]|nr:PhoH family protein [Gemmatimonadales bacterium]
MSSSSPSSGPRGVCRQNLNLEGVDQLSLLGVRDENLRFLEARFGGTLTVRGHRMLIEGLPDSPPQVVEAVVSVVEDLIDRVKNGQRIDQVTIGYLWDRASAPKSGELPFDGTSEPILYSGSTRQSVRVKTSGQQRFVDAVRDNDVVFAVGPAGTGKTFLAVVMAMDYLDRQLVDRIILVRPAVEAGEQLGFLPGDMQEKIHPYMRPLFDSLSDIVGAAKITRLLASGVIEASPLGYMRGRTLNNAFVILDEAQNTTVGQMKMFLTRLGLQSRAVVTGDITQIDLDVGSRSGLVHVREILNEIDGVRFVDLDGRDVVRHPLVRRIVEAFDSAGITDGRS